VDGKRHVPDGPQRILADLRKACRATPTFAPMWAGTKTVSPSNTGVRTRPIFTPGGFATMGFGSPAAMGAKIALKDKVVVAWSVTVAGARTGGALARPRKATSR
jgi:Thiamine pyrophosphate-requiring enzymes [acetolactate synthase, pyruvate dehydrogenase (cytochrome), glyoxylate carboligase, phosphonopyruvate decarboxylase]